VTFPTPGTFHELTPAELVEWNRTTVDCDGTTIKMLDTVESATNKTHRATVGHVYKDGTFDVCDIDIGLFAKQRPGQWRRAAKKSEGG
jgi:hypothetical protein